MHILCTPLSVQVWGDKVKFLKCIRTQHIECYRQGNCSAERSLVVRYSTGYCHGEEYKSHRAWHFL